MRSFLFSFLSRINLASFLQLFKRVVLIHSYGCVACYLATRAFPMFLRVAGINPCASDPSPNSTISSLCEVGWRLYGITDAVVIHINFSLTVLFLSVHFGLGYVLSTILREFLREFQNILMSNIIVVRLDPIFIHVLLSRTLGPDAANGLTRICCLLIETNIRYAKLITTFLSTLGMRRKVLGFFDRHMHSIDDLERGIYARSEPHSERNTCLFCLEPVFCGCLSCRPRAPLPSPPNERTLSLVARNERHTSPVFVAKTGSEKHRHDQGICTARVCETVLSVVADEHQNSTSSPDPTPPRNVANFGARNVVPREEGSLEQLNVDEFSWINNSSHAHANDVTGPHENDATMLSRGQLANGSREMGEGEAGTNIVRFRVFPRKFIECPRCFQCYHRHCFVQHTNFQTNRISQEDVGGVPPKLRACVKCMVEI